MTPPPSWLEIDFGYHVTPINLRIWVGDSALHNSVKWNCGWGRDQTLWCWAGVWKRTSISLATLLRCIFMSWRQHGKSYVTLTQGICKEVAAHPFSPQQEDLSGGSFTCINHSSSWLHSFLSSPHSQVLWNGTDAELWYAIEKWGNLNKFAINTTTPLSIHANRSRPRVDFNVDTSNVKGLWKRVQ